MTLPMGILYSNISMKVRHLQEQQVLQIGKLLLPDILDGHPVLQHLHEGGVAGPLHHLGLALGLLAVVGMQVDLNVGIGLLLCEQ
jgi:hypothetical protein